MISGFNFIQNNRFTGFISLVFALFIVLFPRFTELSKPFYVLLILTGTFYLLVNLKQLKETRLSERLFFIVILLNFGWIAFSFYINKDPTSSDSFLWGRQVFFVFLIPLFLMLRYANISEKTIVLSIFASVLLTLGDISIDLANDIEHRYQGMNPNGFGPIQLSLCGVLLFSAIWGSDKRIRALALVGAVLAMITVILSYSRGTWLAIPFLTVFLIFYLVKSYSIGVKIVSVMVILLILSSSYALPVVKFKIDKSFTNITGYLASDDYRDEIRGESSGTRLELWRAAWQMFLDKPVTGIGIGGIQKMNRDNWKEYEVHQSVQNYIYVHNQYIATMATRGIPGLILFLLLLALPIYIAVSQQSSDNQSKQARLSIIFITITFAIGNLVEDHYETKPAIMFITVFIPVLLAKLQFQKNNSETEYG
ncbi:MAG: O-antigen ligase [Gammaproteobacteria bacterium]|jgi:O-antigen ligase